MRCGRCGCTTAALNGSGRPEAAAVRINQARALWRELGDDRGGDHPLPEALAYARALLTGPPGTVTRIDADLNDPAALLAAARDRLDFTRPAAVLLVSTLGRIGGPG
jgi:hypothetical protein